MNISGLAGGYDAVLARTFSGALRNAGNVFTPRRIVRFMVDAVALGPDDRMIDPACGTGGFLVWAWRRVIELLNADATLTEAQRRSAAQAFADRVFACDEREEAINLAKVNLALHGIRPSAGYRQHFRRHDGLYPGVLRSGVDDGRFDGAVEAGFTVIAMNPPFGKIDFAQHDEHILNLFELGRGRATPIEYLFLERAVRLLEPGGRLAMIVPEGVLSGTKDLARDVRDYLIRVARLIAVVTIPRDVWRTSNSRFETNASIVFAAKKTRPFEPETPTLLAAVEEVNVADPRGDDDLQTLLLDIRAGFYDRG